MYNNTVGACLVHEGCTKYQKGRKIVNRVMDVISLRRTVSLVVVVLGWRERMEGREGERERE